jgi:N6-adenosine-specific RNA methylase IME4
MAAKKTSAHVTSSPKISAGVVGPAPGGRPALDGSWPFAPLERNRFEVIYADPPWQFKTWSARGQGRSPLRHYDCMTLDAICALPVRELATPDALLFLWIAQPTMQQAFEVIGAWGFAYKTIGYVWVKSNGPQGRLFYDDRADVRRGLGYHTRASVELCLLATRGRGYRRLSRSEGQVVFAPVREHSRKPDEVLESIVRLTGDVQRAELFARQLRPGWASWGLETEKFRGRP